MKKGLTSIVAAGVLVTFAAQGAEATLDRSLPTKHSRNAITKAAHLKKEKKTGRAARLGVIVASSTVVCPEQAPGDSGAYCVIVSAGT